MSDQIQIACPIDIWKPSRRGLAIIKPDYFISHSALNRLFNFLWIYIDIC